MDTAPGPTGPQLLELEAEARRRGTGLDPQALVGCWELDQVWPKGSARPSAFSGVLLRGLRARLEISGAPPDLLLRNAVGLGALELRFSGRGQLQGRRPPLQFSFDRLELRFAGRVLLQRRLPQLPPKRWPFFALIARDLTGWLAARGRGGGLALWRLGVANMDPSAAPEHHGLSPLR